MPDDASTIDYFVRELMNANNTITAISYISPDGTIIFQTSNWDISSDIISVLNAWRQTASSVVVQGIKYSTLQCTPERLVSTNILGQGHIVASGERERILLAYVTPDGGAGIAYMDVARTLSQILGTGGAPPQPAPYQPVAPQPAPYQPPAPQPAPMAQPQYEAQPQYIQDQFRQTAARPAEPRPVPKSSWTSGSPDTEMKNIIWEVEEFRKYVETGNLAVFLRNVLQEGDQIKIWEILKLIRHFKSLLQLG